MLRLGKKIKFLHIFWVAFYLLIFSLLLQNSFSYLDPDLGWHLKVGEEIVTTLSVPRLNNYNFTFVDNWVDHEWLANVISYKIYSQFSYLSLSIFFALLIVLSLILLNIFVRKYCKKIPVALIAVLQLFGLIASLPHFGVRMQEFSFLFLILELWILEKYVNDKKVKILLFLVPLFYLWANIHGSFLFGLGVLLLWLIIKTLEKYLLVENFKNLFSSEKIVNGKQLIILLVATIASIAVTLATPYGPELYSFLSGYSNTFYLKTIQEWLPQTNFPFVYSQMAYLALVSAVIIIYIYVLRASKESLKRINLWGLALSLIMIFLAFQSRRNFPLMFAVTFIYLIEPFVLALDLNKIKTFKLRRELKWVLILVMFLSSLNILLKIESVGDPFLTHCSSYPCGALKFLEDKTEYSSLNLLNNYDWGGYLMWTYPQKKIFIDGRLPQVSYKNTSFMEEYLEFLKEDSNYKEKLEEYNIGLILMRTQDYKINAKKWEKFLFSLKDSDLTGPNYLRNYLDSSNEWTLVYRDKVASLYKKNSRD